MERFFIQTGVISGPGAITCLKEMNIQRPLVVADPFFAKNGTAEAVVRAAGGENFRIFDKVLPDPTVTLAAEGAACVREFAPDAVIALGGGSAMDCAKAMTYFSGIKPRLIAIPTTSGSGSEVTNFAILTHGGVKHPLVDPALRPEIAILDSDLLRQLPKTLIADGGFDLISHALEAWVATGGSGMSQALALEAVWRAWMLLPRSYSGDVAVRQRLHEASTMAGMAFSAAGLGICHALSHSLGGEFHVPHGRLNAILLPAVIDRNAIVSGSAYGELARRLGLSTGADAVAVRALKNALTALRRKLGLPQTLAEAGVAPAVLRQKVQTLAQTALEDPCCGTNPVKPTQDMLRSILLEVAGRG